MTSVLDESSPLPVAKPIAPQSVRTAGAVLVLTLVTLAGLLASQGGLALALAACVAILLLWVIARVPLRYPLFVLAFLALTLENPSDVPACGVWRSPLYGFGALMLAHLNVSLPFKWMFFSGMDLLLLYLFALAWIRRFTRSTIEGPSSPSARPMRIAAWTCIGGALWMWTYGLLQSDFDFGSSLWQVQRVIYLPIVFFLFRHALRVTRDARRLGVVIVAAAGLKAVIAVYVRHTVAPPPGETVLAYATTHADSMLFSVALCLLAAPYFEPGEKRRVWLTLILAAVIASGIVANTRRLAWVEVGVGLLTLFVASRRTPFKRTLTRVVVVASPFVVAYLVSGWGQHGAVFRPVEILQSVVDSKADASTEWRDWENYDLFYTIRQAPVLGTGYGHGFTEIVKLPDISRAYPLYRFIPHNSIMGLCAYGGLVGFTALWTILAVGTYLAARARHFARTANEATAALALPTLLAIYIAHCYGDMGLGTWTANFIVAPTLAVAGMLASSTGAWPALRLRTR